ncbi:MAG: type IV pilus assembly protein PilM, partial [Actinomycetota bacterium]|nr:type IV pilus assembly protein PilM [Actinomycetota bacterium]
MAGRPVVGLDIGTSGVRAAELSWGKGSAKLERFGQVALPAGAVRDGEVVDTEAVTAAIGRLWSQAKFSTKKVVVGVANQKVVVRQVDLPWLPIDELRKSLAFQVQDHIPMPVEQAILDFHPLGDITNDAGERMLRVLLVAAARDMVGSSLAAVEGAGLQPTMVDLTPFAVLRSLVAADSGFGSVHAEALVDIGASVTNIIVHQGGVPRFVRILLMGGGDITDAVAERLGVATEQAEAVKQTTGLASVPGMA